MEQKINNLRKERNEIEWSCDQTTSQNNKIEELNEKLKNDLEKVKLHL